MAMTLRKIEAGWSAWGAFCAAVATVLSACFIPCFKPYSLVYLSTLHHSTECVEYYLFA